MEDIFIYIFSTILVIGGMFYLVSKTGPQKPISSPNASFKEEPDGNYTKKVLVINKLSSFNRDVLKIQDIPDMITEYNPAKYVFTAASVGGITTGGVTKLGDNYTISASHTGKYCLMFKGDPNNPRMIEEIMLDGQDIIQKAKNDPKIAELLSGNRIVLSRKSEKYSDKIKAAIQCKRPDLAQQFIKYQWFDGQLTKSECKYILDWVCGIS